MRYVPNAAGDREAMLGEIGAASIEELFRGIPEELRLREALKLPSALSEPELIAEFEAAADRNRVGECTFLGAGVYPHYVPTVVDAMISRSEFYTAYTPYQAEIAQGTLQAIFEFQTYVTQLTGLEVANASLYDGSNALAEAVLMAHRISGRTRVLMARTVHPEYRAVVETYTRRLGLVIELMDSNVQGVLDPEAVEAAAGPDLAAVILQSPNFFGTIENTGAVSEAAHASGALAVVLVAEALSLALLKPPGAGAEERRADIVCGEAQSLGIPMNYGGPHLGFLATRQQYLRQIPGRLVGMGHDAEGRRAFVLTLATREQHIRRERATSNICTNQSLCALMATIHMAVMGPAGLRRAAIQNVRKLHYFIDRIERETQAEVLWGGPRFNEVVVRPTAPARDRLREGARRGRVRGHELGRDFPELDGAFMFALTEVCSKASIDELVGELR